MKLLNLVAATALSACLTLAGCIRAPKLISGELIAAADSEMLCKALTEASSLTPGDRGLSVGVLNGIGERIVSFRTLLDATINSSRGDQVSFRYAIVGKDPSMLRIDVLPAEGAYTLALITVRGSEALFIDPQAKSVMHGCSVKQVLEKLLGLHGMTPGAVRAIIVGRPPPLDCSRMVANRLANDRVLFVDSPEQLAWEVDAATGELYRIYFISPNGESVKAVASREIRGADSFVVVSVYDPLEATADMRIVRLTENPEVADDTFLVDVPAGYTREGC